MGAKLACSNEILNRMGQYNLVMDTVDNQTKVQFIFRGLFCSFQFQSRYIPLMMFNNKLFVKTDFEFFISNDFTAVFPFS